MERLELMDCDVDLRQNSERFLRISSREVTVEGLQVEREGLGEMGVWD